ncbi:SAM-dependent methyltransferase [Streptomyces sp. CSDS2]|uniref:SAM-dependent methyltransferase n=1 Tax=Streptomyces sp. CSDS2 TaxID=3055051 RepID=UPI0025B22FFB|nr:SAM-dependent methyltransferase [Streptomyces sp. CSDS2]MDN3265733.1 SAM-dependent methyltransferase [Streptomyces sp. CSDS2]
MGLGEKRQPRFVDMNTPSVARMYDWLLGGSANYESDREACQRLLDIAPSSRQLAQSNRAFLRRVVRTLVRECNVTQFIDHGSGLPTQDNVHEIAQRLNPSSRVVYVDNDPMVLAHGRTTLDEDDRTLILDHDMRDSEEILRTARNFLSWEKPVAALFVSVLHCLPDTDDDRDPACVVRRVAAALPPGSYMVICQLVSDDPEVRKGVTDLMAQVTHDRWGRVRRTAEVERYFDGLHILPPGLGDVIDWRPDVTPPPRHLRPTDWVEWGGVARV